MPESILVALGGNALIRAGRPETVREQGAALVESLAGIVEFVRRGHSLVMTHGNGPQVGHILMRAEEARGKAYELPLDVCVAQSQGEIGYLIQQTLQNLLHREGLDRRVVSLVTRTVVKKDDPRMTDPTKPIGPFYTKEQAEKLRASGLHMIEDAHRGFRRVVPSPLPVEVVEADVVGRLMEAGVLTIVAGGGGIPVYRSSDGEFQGIEAVVDKDLASAVLAAEVGIEKILNLTAVEHAKLNYGTASEHNLHDLTSADAKKFLDEGHFLPGSMGPKVEAAIQFLEHGGREFIITLPEKALDGYAGKTGTRIRPR